MGRRLICHTAWIWNYGKQRNFNVIIRLFFCENKVSYKLSILFVEGGQENKDSIKLMSEIKGNICVYPCVWGNMCVWCMCIWRSKHDCQWVPLDANHHVFTLGPGTPRTRPAGPKDNPVSSTQCWNCYCVPPGLALHSGVGVQLGSSCTLLTKPSLYPRKATFTVAKSPQITPLVHKSASHLLSVWIWGVFFWLSSLYYKLPLLRWWQCRSECLFRQYSDASLESSVPSVRASCGYWSICWSQGW